MRSLFPAPAFRAAAAAVALAAATPILVAAVARPAAAQTPRDDAEQMERPEVREVRLVGVKSVDKGDLRDALATQPSRCLGLIQRPFCAFSKSPLFYERKYLDREEFRRDVVRLLVYYYRRGWRDARVDTSVVDGGDNKVRVVFEVTEGEPTRVASSVVEDTSGVLTPRQIRRVLRPRPGDPLNLLQLDSSVVALRSVLWNLGRGDAVVQRPDIAVDDSSNRARVSIGVRPGPLTPIASVRVLHLRPDSKVSDETIRNSLTFKPGDLFRRTEIARSQRILYESNLFRSAIIDTAVAREASTGRTVCAQQGSMAATPEARAAAGMRADSTKAVVVCVLEGSLREARASTGFTTADFFQVEGRFTHNYWLGGARVLNITGVVGNLGAEQLFGTFPWNIANGYLAGDAQQDALAQAGRFFEPTYSLGVEVRQRWFGSPRNTIAAGTFLHRRSSPGVFVDRSHGGNLTFTRTVAPRAPASATYRFEVSRVEAGDVYFCVSFGVCDRPTVSALQGQQRLSPVALTLSASTADDPLGPTSGFILRGETEHASAYTVSDFRYNRAVAEASTYRRLGFGPGARSGRRGRPPVLAFRLRAGAVRALGSTNEAVIRGGPAEELLGNILHPRKRFYAGGSQSVRGFGENQLGPRVLTIAPNLLRGRQIRDGDTTYTRCQPTEPIAACGARVLNDTTLPDRDFVPRPLGGTSLIEGNVELRMPVWGPVVVAAFVDGAVVGEGSLGDLGSATSAVTPGVGVRYLSPVGPVRVDVGFRPRLPEDLAVVTEEEMANGTRRLVNLTPRQGCSARPNACRRYGETSNGGFRSFLDRLTLHLSIGEAF